MSIEFTYNALIRLGHRDVVDNFASSPLPYDKQAALKTFLSSALDTAAVQQLGTALGSQTVLITLPLGASKLVQPYRLQLKYPPKPPSVTHRLIKELYSIDEE